VISVCLSPVTVGRWDEAGAHREHLSIPHQIVAAGFASGLPVKGTAVFINAARSTVEIASETIGVVGMRGNAGSDQSKAVWGSIIH
jgi:hypothetical protein